MASKFKPTAIAFAFFAAYVIPTVALFAVGALGASSSEDGNFSAPWISLLIMGAYVICPVAGGVLVTRLASHQVTLHVLTLSILAAVSLGFMTQPPSLQSMIWWTAVFSIGGLTGAWLHQKLCPKQEE